MPASADAVRAEKLDLVFLATPANVSIELAPAFLDVGAKVIDLSGAFRLGDAEAYSRWYGERHTRPELFDQAVYGLAEFYRDRIRDARLLANPGCYPTAANLALRPLVEAEVIDRTRGVICDAKSGVSGAGRKATLKTHFCEVTDNFSAYGFSSHRHVPEVLQNSGLGEREFTFTAQLLPLHRGILETIYIRTQSVGAAIDLLSIYEDRYRDEPFVRLYAPGKVPDLRAVQGTNFCDIGFVFEADVQRATLVVAEDNLGKGAAGQAVQNMNLMLGFPETQALL
jgi:N-acetyl-gamma-glutamyl-phosphate reductase